MNRFLPTIIILSLIFSGCGYLLPSVELYPDEEIDTNRLYSPEELKEDLDYLFQTLENVHPNLYAFTPKDTIDADRKQIVKKLLKPMTALEFWRLVRPIVSKIGDGHTSLRFPSEFRKVYLDNGGLIVPFDIYIDDGKMFIEKNYSSDSTLIVNSEILSINDIPAQDIINDMVKYVSGERIENRHNRIKRNFKLLLWSLFHLEDEFDVHFISATDSSTYVRKLKGITVETLNSFKKDEKETEYKYYSYSSPEKNIGIIDFKQLSDPKKFMKFLKTTFRKIKKDSLENLIIDIRQNGGGGSRLGDALINYIYDKPYYQFERGEIKFSSEIRRLYFNKYIKWYMYPLIPFAYLHPSARAFLRGSGSVITQKNKADKPNNNELFFNGNVYLLIGPKTFSSASSLTSAFKCFKIGTIIGEETGGLTVSYGDVYTFTLPNTGIQCGVSHKKFIQACGKEDSHGVIPDYEVKQTPEDTEKGIDTVLEFTKEFIRNDQTLRKF